MNKSISWLVFSIVMFIVCTMIGTTVGINIAERIMQHNAKVERCTAMKYTWIRTEQKCIAAPTVAIE